MRTFEEIEAEHQRLMKQDREEIERHDWEFREKVDRMIERVNRKWDNFADEKMQGFVDNAREIPQLPK